MFRKLLILLLSLLLILLYVGLSSIAEAQSKHEDLDSLQKTRELLYGAKVKSVDKDIEMTIRNADISNFPIIKIIVEAYNVNGEPLDTLYADKISVLENNVEKKVISVDKISFNERVPVDFVFLIDKTGSMQTFINGVMNNISNFSTSLVSRGIDFRIGLILFSDFIEQIYQPTDDVFAFMSWLSKVEAKGGKDEKENALEAIAQFTKMSFRPSANRVGVLITDAPYHQAGESGEGTTLFNTESIIKLLNNSESRLFSIVPPRLTEYKTISLSTRGNSYNINYPFSTILDNFSDQLTNLYALKYRTSEPAIPDSINIALLNEKKQELVRKIIPIVELGRKLIIENLLFKTNSYELEDEVGELDILNEFMENKPNVVILVEGHTDGIGSNQLNDALSLNRAESVKNYLVKKGIASYRIKTKGYGKRRPIATNDTEFGRQLNRRTEIVIIAK